MKPAKILDGLFAMLELLYRLPDGFYAIDNNCTVAYYIKVNGRIARV